MRPYEIACLNINSCFVANRWSIEFVRPPLWIKLETSTVFVSLWTLERVELLLINTVVCAVNWNKAGTALVANKSVLPADLHAKKEASECCIVIARQIANTTYNQRIGSCNPGNNFSYPFPVRFFGTLGKSVEHRLFGIDCHGNLRHINMYQWLHISNLSKDVIAPLKIIFAPHFSLV